jgi:hypothetical protein
MTPSDIEVSPRDEVSQLDLPMANERRARQHQVILAREFQKKKFTSRFILGIDYGSSYLCMHCKSVESACPILSKYSFM